MRKTNKNQICAITYETLLKYEAPGGGSYRGNSEHNSTGRRQEVQWCGRMDALLDSLTLSRKTQVDMHQKTYIKTCYNIKNKDL